MIEAQLFIRSASGSRQVALADYLDPVAEESAHDAAYAWIKALRHLPVDGAAFRDRFTARGDSLWWFTEIYLHKEQVILAIHRVIRALTTLIERESPAEITVLSGSHVVRHLAPSVGAARGVPCGAPPNPLTWLKRLTSLDLHARRLVLTAFASADRWQRSPAPSRPVDVAAFIHRAFWRGGSADGSSESYIGPILAELERRLDAGSVRYVGIGAAANFRTKRRRRFRGTRPTSVIPVERFASWSGLACSRAAWRERFSRYRALTQAPAIRDAARIDGVDCWPLVKEQLAGVAFLQWPWSVRAMDEAGAALDALSPGGVVTYAEAGGWGRALILEARRRKIPSAGLQHGFIYRHWLNYRHEPDEMENRTTAGFPHPSRTLLFDTYAARHLRELGRFPPETLVVTGSARRDEIVREVAALPSTSGELLREALAIGAEEEIVVVTTKEKEARGSLGGLIDAAAHLPGVKIVIKPHPAETADAYWAFLQGRPHVTVVAEGASLSPLLAAARALVTVNSTVALDAAEMGVPTLVLGLPNNLSPFVAAGAMAGSPDPADLPALLHRILYDEGFRQQLADRVRAVLGESMTVPGSGAAARSADVILDLIRESRTGAAD